MVGTVLSTRDPRLTRRGPCPQRARSHNHGAGKQPAQVWPSLHTPALTQRQPLTIHSPSEPRFSLGIGPPDPPPPGTAANPQIT